MLSQLPRHLLRPTNKHSNPLIAVAEQVIHDLAEIGPLAAMRGRAVPVPPPVAAHGAHLHRFPGRRSEPSFGRRRGVRSAGKSRIKWSSRLGSSVAGKINVHIVVVQEAGFPVASGIGGDSPGGVSCSAHGPDEVDFDAWVVGADGAVEGDAEGGTHAACDEEDAVYGGGVEEIRVSSGKGTVGALDGEGDVGGPIATVTGRSGGE